ncbi:MAG: hypothetical protein AAF211_02975 [Myxococcota bacterium]
MTFNPRDWFWGSVGTVEAALQTLEPNPDVDAIDLALLEVEEAIEDAKAEVNSAAEGSHKAELATETLCALSGALIVLRLLRPPEGESTSASVSIDPDRLGLIPPTGVAHAG